MNNIDKVIRFIKEIENLKSVTRTAWTKTGRRESTAEHSWRLAMLLMVLREDFKDLDIDITHAELKEKATYRSYYGLLKYYSRNGSDMTDYSYAFIEIDGDKSPHGYLELAMLYSKLNDLDASISLEFGGMSLPDDIYNGDYLLGSFMLCESSLSKWVSGNISCYYNYDTKQFWMTNGENEIAGSRKTLTPDNNGNIKETDVDSKNLLSRIQYSYMSVPKYCLSLLTGIFRRYIQASALLPKDSSA